MKYYNIQSIPEWIYCDTDAIYFRKKEKKGTEKMKESKFKVGDKVIIKDGSKIKNYQGGWIRDMAEYVGRICTISFVAHRSDNSYAYRMKEIDYTWDERGLAPADETIIISKEGNKVTAKCNGLTGIARCNPEDVFEYKTGVMLAIERLFADMDSIKEGDSVVVTDTGHTYSTYTSWVIENIKNKELIAKYKYGETPVKGEKFHVEKIAKHGGWNDMVAFISGISGCYLIGLKGLKKV